MLKRLEYTLALISWNCRLAKYEKDYLLDMNTINVSEMTFNEAKNSLSNFSF